jgi:hypothetical protein
MIEPPDHPADVTAVALAALSWAYWHPAPGEQLPRSAMARTAAQRAAERAASEQELRAAFRAAGWIT